MLLTLVAAASFACPLPLHPDGMSIECGHARKVWRIDGISASRPLDSCKSWELFCRPDPGTRARDHLADLTRGLAVECRVVAGDRVACSAGGRDLTCAMIVDGVATPTHGGRHCPAPPAAAPLLGSDAVPPTWAILAFLALVNLIAVLLVAFDAYRRRRGFGPIADRLLALLALLGGGGAVLVAQWSFAGDDDRGVSPLIAIILGLQIGAAAGLLLL